MSEYDGSLNHCHLVGHVSSINGDGFNERNKSTFVSLVVAVTTSRRNRDGSFRERVDDFRVVAYSDAAEYVLTMLEPGMAVRIEGPMRTVKWTKKECGCIHYNREVLAKFIARLPGDIEYVYE